VNARRTALQRGDALRLAGDADEIYVAKGRQVIHIGMRTGSTDEDALARLLLGPTGNRRSPTLKKGRTVIVGFDESTYRKLLLDYP
jgi:hypothetical protein